MPAPAIQEVELLRSDGDPKSWPTPTAPGQQGFYVAANLDEEASIQWRFKIGAHVAKCLKLPNGPKYILKDWPEGYKLFVHCKGSRRDKYLFGRTGARYRSAAEFIPHAEWLCADEQSACECSYCSRGKPAKPSSRGGLYLKGKVQRPKPRSSLPPLAKSPSSRGPAKPTPSASPRRSRRSHSNLSRLSSTPKPPTVHSPTHDTQKVLGYVRVATPKPVMGSADLEATSWPAMHELVWCKLPHPIAWGDVTIDFWPGIIKIELKGREEYLVTLLGNTCDVRISVYAMVPYQSYWVKATLLHKLQPTCQNHGRAPLLDLQGYARREIDYAHFSAISSAFLFAVSFSAHLATAWSWSYQTACSTPASSMSRPMRYSLRSRSPKQEQYGNLWWGPERIEVRQLVLLKVLTSSISIDPDVEAIPVPATHLARLNQPVYLQIRSIFNRQKTQERGDHLVGPVVAGMIFDLVDTSQYGVVICQHEDLPSPPTGKVFRPLLKEGYEIVLPITTISNCYRGAVEGISKEVPLTTMERWKQNPIKPITFQQTRAKMLEYAYEMSRKYPACITENEDRASKG